MKNKIQVFIILLTVSIMSIKCSPKLFKTYTDKENKHKMEKINIDDLFNEENRQTKNKTILVDYKLNSKRERVYISYKEIHEGGKIILISGRKGNSFRKNIRYKDSPMEEYFEFYPSGNLNKKGKVYIGFLKESSNKKMYRPFFNVSLGKWMQYADNGNLLKTWDANEGFKIDIEDLNEILKKEGDLSLQNNVQNIRRKTITQVTEMKKVWKFKTNEINPSWFIQYKNETNKVLFMLIDGVTGLILYKGIVLTEENEN